MIFGIEGAIKGYEVAFFLTPMPSGATWYIDSGAMYNVEIKKYDNEGYVKEIMIHGKMLLP